MESLENATAFTPIYIAIEVLKAVIGRTLLNS